MKYTAALGHIKKMLLKLSATGEKGFEGLIATVMAGVSGLTFRLANSGLQEGRDASSTPSSRFAISLECKRYDGRLTFERLAGKAAIASHVLGGEVDVWALAATSEVSDQTAAKIADLLEANGVSLVLLDWPAQGLPPLAALLAVEHELTLSWFDVHAPDFDRGKLAAALKAVGNLPGFKETSGELRKSLDEASIGLHALQRLARRWLLERLSSVSLSQVSFGQGIAPLAASSRMISRPGHVASLQGKLDRAGPGGVVAILGEEGDGKTWIAANWACRIADPPVIVFVAGRLVEMLDEKDILLSLSRLITHQEGKSDEKSLRSWVRRLGRWKSPNATDVVRFVVVLDGLNERPRAPWADIIRALSLELALLGGRIIVTSRSGFWNRDVKSRLGVAAAEEVVGRYSREELSERLLRSGRDLDRLPDTVRDFISNPRVCEVAMTILDRLLLQPEDLTVERLLLEYWRSRLVDRGDHLVHNVEDFHKVLREHARHWLNKPGTHFDRDNWADRSGAAQRLGPGSVFGDLTEIEEGRFLTVDPSNLSRYSFRQEALPFAVALLITKQISDGLREGGLAPEILESLLHPVAGFDRTADILAASAGLALNDPNYPAEGREAILVRWLELQNVSTESLTSMAAHVPLNPGVFLDLVELPRSQSSDALQSDVLVNLIAMRRDSPAVQMALRARLKRWLGLWARRTRHLFGGEHDKPIHAKRQASIERKIAETKDSSWLHQRFLEFEIAEQPSLRLDVVAAWLLAARPLASHASGLLSWAFTREIAGDLPDAHDDLAWVVRLNAIDWKATHAAVHALVDGVSASAHQVTRASAATVLRLLGDPNSALQAEEIFERWKGTRAERRGRYCDVNPVNPAAGPASQSTLQTARDVLGQVEPQLLWLYMSTTAEEANLKDVTLPLLRFDPAPLIAKLNDVAATASSRTGLALRQLAWRLPELSQILSGESLRSVQSALDQVILDRTRLPPEDRWAIGQIAECLLARSEANRQLEILTSLPADLPLYFSLRTGLFPFSPEVLEAHLMRLSEPGREREFRWLLFMAGATRNRLTPVGREIVVEAMFSADKEVASTAATVVNSSFDDEVAALIVACVQIRHPDPIREDEGADVARAVARSVIAVGRSDLLRYVSDRYLGSAAAELGMPAAGHFGLYLAAVFSRLKQPVASAAPAGVLMHQQATRDEQEIIAWCDALPEGPQTLSPKELFALMSDGPAQEQERARRESDMIEAARRYRSSLSREGALGAIAVPSFRGAVAFVRHVPVSARKLLTEFLDLPDDVERIRLRDFALVLASAFASVDGRLARDVFAICLDIEPHIGTVVGAERIPLSLSALFRAEQVSELDALRARVADDALTDADLSMVALAAEIEGASVWLEQYIDGLINRGEPRDLARAYTLAAFRAPNSHSDALLASAPGVGFLGDVSTAARNRYRKAGWMRHWLEVLLAADDGLGVFSAGRFLEEVVDLRVFRLLEELASNDAVKARRVRMLYEDLSKAARKVHKDDENFLFGSKAPSRELRSMLQDICTEASSAILA